jgi:virulence factor Mce-like protein
MRSRPLAVRLVVALVAVVLAVVVVQVVLRFSDGDFSGDYPLEASFTSATHGLFPDAEVVYRGVQVGRVSAVRLVDRRAQVAMEIDPGFRVPADAAATIEPVNVFGADEVSLSFPAGSGDHALRPGGTIRRTSVDPSLNGLFQAAAPLLDRVDTTDLSTVLATLAQAAQGEGPTIARSIDEGAKLAAFLDQTLPAQITALDAFDNFSGALAPTASSLDAIGAGSNQFFPTLVANRAAYDQLLADVTPFANNLSQFLSAYHPDIEQLLANGADVARLVLANQQQIGTLVRGLAIYEDKFATAFDPAERLPNGTEFGYFSVFVTVQNLNQLVCALLDPQIPNASFLAPLQQALTGVGSAINCSNQLNFGGGGTSSTGSTSTSGTSQTTPSVSQAAQNLSTDLYGLLGQPSGSAASAGSAPTGSSSTDGSGASGSSSSTNALRSLLGGLL